MTRAVLSIGSNIGDSLGHLRTVVDALADSVVSVSPVYVTPPWGGVEQQDFLNAIVVVDDPDVDASQWLRRGQELEAAADRVRETRWGPRTLDVDVVACYDTSANELGESITSGDPELTLPHPRAHERAFVLIPWLDVDPDARLVVDGEPVRVDQLVERLDASERTGVRRHEGVLR
ncbi:MAG: 2-amino-4-hydroxy-6-hydroxymethyldihydropteridine diphosphokinase [Rhodococcus sp.]|nr:2-amino-4-hydroxy-6-hydroxymethyldihydropteridine diphosphokinase [Rhodococcus sp. (in: high G+C Gram-positive bacteria)]